MLRQRRQRWSTLAAIIFATLAPLTVSVRGGAAQMARRLDPSRAEVTRSELERILAEYTATASSGGYSDAFRERARAEAALIRDRLTEGDLQVGDRIRLVVEGQPTLTDTFTVSAGRVIVLPNVGEIPVRGVLRSETEDYLTKQIGRYIREPVVHARTLMRVLITGAVARPGYYLLPSEALLTDVLMAAGGPAANASIEKIRVERDDRAIWQHAALQQMITEGRTLDQLSLRAGDRIIVPARSGGSWATLRDVLYVVSPIAVLLTTLVFR